MDQLELRLGMSVRGRDAHVGKVTHLITDAKGRHVTDLIVERGIPLLSREACVVPVAAIEGTREDAVWLSVSCDESCDNVDVFDNSRERSERTELAGAAQVEAGAIGIGYGPAAIAPAVRSHLRQDVAADRLLLGRQTAVKTLHRSLGQVDGVLAHAESAALMAIVVRRGLLRPESVFVPVEMIEEVGEEEILLNVSSDMVDELPRNSSVDCAN